MISDKTVEILVQSRDASYSATFTAVVTHSITDYQSHFNINATSWKTPQNISLVDPNFNQSQRIDLLLGAGLFFKIISSIVKRFWEIEVFTSFKPSLLPEDLRCEQLFTENCTRLGNGLHSVRLLSTSEFESQGDYYCLARRRFKSLEAKLDRNPDLKAQYSAFLREYIDLGHMSLVTKEPSETQFFLPHHCVHKQESTSTKLPYF